MYVHIQSDSIEDSRCNKTRSSFVQESGDALQELAKTKEVEVN